MYDGIHSISAARASIASLSILINHWLSERISIGVLHRSCITPIYSPAIVEFYDRCKTPIEILSESQWFIKIDKDAILARAAEIEWIPSYMFHRLKNWTESVEWDWCISRQRIFATPIPVWYCDECGKVMVAEEQWLPLDPTQEAPRCVCECSSSSFTPEYDVLDTWMDSSLSALNAAGWPEAQYQT